MTNEIEGAPPGLGYTHAHHCPKCFRNERCTDDCTREPPYYSRGVHLVCSECVGEIEHVDTDVMRAVIAELERWEKSPSLACQTVAASMRAVLGDAPHLDGGARALDASEALRDGSLVAGDSVRSYTGRTGVVLDTPDSDGDVFVRWTGRDDGSYAPASSLRRIPAEPAVTFSLPAATSLDFSRERIAAMLLSDDETVASAEALREARVQGMREGARIMKECMRLWRGDPDGTMPDWENADTTLATAIEAVRKGER